MKSVYKIQVLLKYNNSNCYFILSRIQIYDYVCTNPYYSFKISDRVCGKIQNITLYTLTYFDVE
jgi:hypothetical protein